LHLGNDVDDVQSVANHKHLLPESTLWKLCHDVSAGLSYIHGQNIVHLDIKPDNIFFVSHVRLGAICKIGDFGLARHVDSMEEGEEGDTAYMSSELLLSSDLKYPKKCDIFSLGLTLYELSCDNLELPVEGPRWHELRCGDHDPILPPIRSGALKDMIKCMISRSQDRPSADMILSHDKVTAAGSWYDNFLHDYIHDIEVADIEREKRLSEIHLESR
jgi:serine/threonine protein kinase